jgi:hypothetical protein
VIAVPQVQAFEPVATFKYGVVCWRYSCWLCTWRVINYLSTVQKLLMRITVEGLGLYLVQSGPIAPFLVPSIPSFLVLSLLWNTHIHNYSGGLPKVMLEYGICESQIYEANHTSNTV